MQPTNEQPPVDPAEEVQETESIATFMAETDAKIEELTQKMDAFGRLTIQAIMELESAIEEGSKKKEGDLRKELSLVKKQLSAIIEE